MMSFGPIFEDDSWYYKWDKIPRVYARGKNGAKDWAITPEMVNKYYKKNNKMNDWNAYWLTRLGVTIPTSLALHAGGVKEPWMYGYLAGHLVADPLAFYWNNERNSTIAKNPNIYRKK